MAKKIRTGWRNLARLGMAAAIVAGLAGSARAADVCIEWKTLTTTHQLVGKAFRVPGKGKCRPFAGFDIAYPSLFDATGSGCTASDGSELRLVLTASREGYSPIFFHVTLPLPLGPGGEMSGSGIDLGFPIVSVHPVQCPAPVVPIP